MNSSEAIDLASRSLTALEEMALQRLNLCGCRFVPFSGGYIVGLWKDLDWAEVRLKMWK